MKKQSKRKIKYKERRVGLNNDRDKIKTKIREPVKRISKR